LLSKRSQCVCVYLPLLTKRTQFVCFYLALLSKRFQFVCVYLPLLSNRFQIVSVYLAFLNKKTQFVYVTLAASMAQWVFLASKLLANTGSASRHSNTARMPTVLFKMADRQRIHSYWTRSYRESLGKHISTNIKIL
jgi:hypothetical protein